MSTALAGHPEQQLGLGHDPAVHLRDAVRAGERRPPAAERHLEAQPVARHDLAPELRAVHAAQIRPTGGAGALPLHEQERRHLRERLDHQDARHERRAGKMPLEELLVDGDVLHGHQPVPWLVLGHRVDEERWIAIAEAVDHRRDVDGHRGHRRVGSE